MNFNNRLNCCRQFLSIQSLLMWALSDCRITINKQFAQNQKWSGWISWIVNPVFTKMWRYSTRYYSIATLGTLWICSSGLFYSKIKFITGSWPQHSFEIKCFWKIQFAICDSPRLYTFFQECDGGFWSSNFVAHAAFVVAKMMFFRVTDYHGAPEKKFIWFL